MVKKFALNIVVILEPMISVNYLCSFMTYLGFGHTCSIHEYGSKVFVMWNDNIEALLVGGSDQVYHISIIYRSICLSCLALFVYTKWNLNERQVLWDNLMDFGNGSRIP